MRDFPKFIRCKDNTLVRRELEVGRIYECSGEQDHNYYIGGKWFTKGRFEVATLEDWLTQRAQRA